MKKLILFLILLVSAGIITLEAQSGYRLVRKIGIAGEGGWDYISVDDSAGRLYVSHSSVAQVIDIKTGNTIATIPGTKGIHGIAIAPELNKGFTSNGRDSSVTVFNLSTFETTGKITVTGKNPDAVVFDPFSKYIFTFNGGSSNSTVIDAKENRVIATIPLEGKPEFAVTDGKGNIYVNIEDKSLLTVISTRTLKVTRKWSLSPGEEPTGLALDKENGRLFSVCSNKKMIVSDVSAGKVIAVVPIGDGCDGVAFDKGYKRIYSSNGEGTITVVQEENKDKYKVLETVKTQKGARTITLDQKNHHLYLPVAEYESTADNNSRRPPVKPGTFSVLEIETLK